MVLTEQEINELIQSRWEDIERTAATASNEGREHDWNAKQAIQRALARIDELGMALEERGPNARLAKKLRARAAENFK